MKAERNQMPEGVKVLNYKQSNKTIDIADVPILVKDALLAGLQKNDSDPFYKIEAIDYPAVGTGGIYEKSFFTSFLNVLKQRPIPGSKRGHEWLSRPNNDFYMVGGKMVDNADGTGTVFFLMYIPPVGDGTDNAGFIRDANAGLVHFSLVTVPEWKIKKDPATGLETRYFTKTNGRERNDAVEYGAGAMEQTVNSDIGEIEEIKQAIESGCINRDTDIDGDVLQNGIVYRSALRRRISRATEENERQELGKLLSMIDKKSNGGKAVELKEAIEVVQTAMKNGALALTDLVKNTGAEKLVKNEIDESKIVVANALLAKLGDKPVEALDAILAENKANADATVENAIVATFGAKTVKVKGKDAENPAYKYAVTRCSGKTGDALKNEIEALKDDVVMKSIKANQADPNSKTNILANGGTGAGAVPEIRAC